MIQIRNDFYIRQKIMVFDPHVQSNVLYNGTGQLIDTGGSADTVLEFNCDFTFENKNYSVSFSASRY